jgi:ribonuclease BN (tRNA processing enzyme)
LKLTVVGSSCSIPRPGRACSSYLIEGAGAAVLADLGTGAFANLRRHRAFDAFDAIVISHMHADHFLDVIPMRYALKYGERTNARRPLLYLPPGGAEMLRELVGAFAKESGDFLGDAFDVRTYDPRDALRVGDMVVRFAPTAHYIATYAMRFEAAGASVTYSADTAPDEGVVTLARDTDAFVCEATLHEENETNLPRGHLSAREAGAMAKRAAARRLLLSHYPASTDSASLEAGARSTFDGRIHVVDDGFTLDLGG